MKSQSILVLLDILKDASISLRVNTIRDAKCILERVKREGVSFLTLTLPDFCTDFEKSLSEGRVSTSRFLAFKKRGALPRFLGGLLGLIFDTKSGELLQEPNVNAILFVRQITLMHKKIELPCSRARTLKAIRAYLETNESCLSWTICAQAAALQPLTPGFPRKEPSMARLLSPYGATWSEEGQDIAEIAHCWGTRADPDHQGEVSTPHRDTYLKTEVQRPPGEMSAAELKWTLQYEGYLAMFRLISYELWSEWMIDDRAFLPENLIPKHGPGATAERIKGNAKYKLSSWHDRLEACFPLDLFGIPNWGHHEALADVRMLARENEPPVRVVPVPKTLKGPRVISIEPVCMQYTQQAVMEVLVKQLERGNRNPKIGSFAEGVLNFSSNKRNQDLALKGSRDGSYATLDLKDASDRVPYSLVRLMLAHCPNLWAACDASRSHQARIRKDLCPFVNGKAATRGLDIPLWRFASMGSALCFPIEAMVFLTAVMVGIGLHSISKIGGGLGTFYDAISWLNAKDEIKGIASFRQALSQVCIYGDDIIVPTDYAKSVKASLEAFNLKVNTNKTFFTGRFRESCGLDAYDGHRVTPVYIHTDVPTSRRQEKEIISTVSLRNQLYQAGFWVAVARLDRHLGQYITLPRTGDQATILGRISFYTKAEATRWDTEMHRWLVKGYKVHPKKVSTEMCDHQALLKFFLRRGRPSVEGGWLKPESRENLDSDGRSPAVALKLVWAPAA